MRIRRVVLDNFRCHRHLETELEPLTVLVGQNGTGKSTVLEAIQACIDGRPLADADRNREAQGDDPITVELEMVDLDELDRSVLGADPKAETVLVRRVWTVGQSKLELQRLAAPMFQTVRDPSSGALARRNAHKTLIEEHPDLGLPPDRPIEELMRSIADWERAHPDMCQPIWTPSGSPLALQQRIVMVRVPAVRETSLEVREGRDTTLSRLLNILATDDASAGPLDALRAATQQRYDEDVAPLQRARLDRMQADLDGHIKNFVPGAQIEMDVLPAEVTIPSPGVVLRAGQPPEVTDIGRQGHGFQRALLMAILQLAGEVQTGGSRPSVLLGVDEPELFQHPAMARHVGDLLGQLASRAEQRFQVCFTTHSALLIDAHKFEGLRVFRRRPDGTRSVGHATQDEVANRLDSLGEGPATRNVARAIDATFAEAFFASAVILCEGSRDIASIRGAADHLGIDLDSLGVTLVAGGKGSLPLRYAILESLDIPTFVVFDADGGCKEEARTNTAALNRALLVMTGSPESDFPKTSVFERCACFEQDLDRHLHSVPEFQRKFDEIALEAGDVERDDALQTRRAAVSELDFPILNEIVRRAVGMISRQ